MHTFRLRLILALVACVTAVSVASTYFEVLAHKHFLREDLQHRSQWMGTSIQPDVEQLLAAGYGDELPDLLNTAKARTGAMGLGVFRADGTLLAWTGSEDLAKTLLHQPVEKSLRKGSVQAQFGRTGDEQWLEEAFPLHHGNELEGSLVLVADSSYIRGESYDLWRRSFLRILALVVLITAVTFVMVRWLLLQPMLRVAERMRRLRIGHGDEKDDAGKRELSLFSPLAREVETLAESLIAARAAAEAEARLRATGENLWTAERLAVFMRENAGSSKIFVVSNREPYMHVRQGREITCVVPPSGLVTAIEPVLRACDGVWVAGGSGNADKETVDKFDRLRVPPDDPRYTLRRVWLTEEEEAKYYDGFANEGLWPLCHIAHTRPIFRPGDWECYQRVNERFASALLEEMEGCVDPVVFVQDYHFTLLPRLVKAARPDARVAIFWHIPWPNPEAFGICPWQAELLDGLLGADLIGFHIPLHCNNFLSTVDRVIESRTDREHMSVSRHGHITNVRPYPVSVAFEGPVTALRSDQEERQDRDTARTELLREFGVRAESIALGVDRMDYTKGIVERLLAFEHLIEEHPWYWERLTFVQIAAPSRTRIPAYADLHRRVNEEVERINLRFQTPRWKPILLLERQYSHKEVDRWYKVSDLCLVTSLHDGMNLVAKEYVAARDDEDGVLILSKFTGAAVELRDALVVNPYDIEGVAEAMHRGLEMNRVERQDRMQRMRRQVMENNIYRWAANVLSGLREIRLDGNGSADGFAPASMAMAAQDGAHRKLA
ncbi:MAG TPA: trehalose-6-phosphate synthase [Terracidiphilus sp.]|jgi:alpha,alpha-trehalose-phosphate synthase [UDP-forming]|nr:trehalose-6-phosphate synthase [Terracidiphilus sp.]